LVRSAIDLAHNLELFVTAEGVEDLAALTMLCEMGCDHAQGFALAVPVPADHLANACVQAEKVARAALMPAVVEIRSAGDDRHASDAAVA
jgi:EAL domain-containing protein (putative c-di-GMP-specific phosphodiesterase class I)